jgi:ATP-dependent protease ClpP protease subunit
MALIVYAAGHHRLASKYATFMYHEANYGLDGKVTIHKQEIKEADRTEKICDDYLLSKTKFTKKQFDNIKKTQGEWYFDINVAKKHGLVDEIL